MCQNNTHSDGNTLGKCKGERFEIVEGRTTKVVGSHQSMRGQVSLDPQAPGKTLGGKPSEEKIKIENDEGRSPREEDIRWIKEDKCQ
jgi:hypothetical protein